MAVNESFGKNRFGEPVDRITLSNSRGARVRIMTHGATVLSFEVPDRNGQMVDIVLGHDTAEEYAERTPYFGCAVGRFANRIRGGRFILDGKEYQLARNNGPNFLHGGVKGFDKVIWTAEPAISGRSVRLTYVSPDGEEGFPGEVKTVITCTLTDDHALIMDYEAETTRATPYTITNHSYFNLAGHNSGSIADHQLMIDADTYLPLDETYLPAGSPESVENSVFDFRTPRRIGDGLYSSNEQIAASRGYGHTYCLNPNISGGLIPAARAHDPRSERTLEMFTTEPGVVFYTGNFIKEELAGKGGCRYAPHHGFCLETQHYPDSPNRPDFPDCILRPGIPFYSRTVYRISESG